MSRRMILLLSFVSLTASAAEVPAEFMKGHTYSLVSGPRAACSETVDPEMTMMEGKLYFVLDGPASFRVGVI